MQEWFKKRIGYSGDVKDISVQVCKDYKLGEFKSNKVVLHGYEDFNFVLETTKGKYFVKIFRLSRNLEECKRYISLLTESFKAKVSMPKLYKSRQGYLHLITLNGTKLRLCVMEYIDGKTFYELRVKLTPAEIKFIANQAAIINSINFKPTFLYDSWAITSFLREYKRKGGALKPEDEKLLRPLIKEFKDLNIESLPHCFVHGDLITTNVMRAKNGILYIIDFAVSNYAPRIQELAVIGCNIILDENNKETTQRNIQLLLEEYQRKIKLTKRELEAFPTYLKLAYAIYVLSANYEYVVRKDHREETQYWCNQSRIGLKQTL